MSPRTPHRELITVAQAATMLDMPKRTLQRHIVRGLIPASKLAGATGAYVIDRRDIDRLIAQRLGRAG